MAMPVASKSPPPDSASMRRELVMAQPRLGVAWAVNGAASQLFRLAGSTAAPFGNRIRLASLRLALAGVNWQLEPDGPRTLCSSPARSTARFRAVSFAAIDT